MAEPSTVTAAPAGRDAAGVAEAALPGSAPSAGTPPTSAGRPFAPKPPLNQIYALPAPIRTFPLPTFYPNNPVSLLHLVYAWLSQVFRPPPHEPSVVHVAVWDPETRSVHVRDDASILALWEQGFYGKGSLSRSEPNWLKRELARRGSPEGKTVSEARTELRREERRLAKWERAKVELEAIEKQRLAEAAPHAAAVEASKVNGVIDEPVDVAESLAHPSSVQPAVVEPSSTDVVVETTKTALAVDIPRPLPPNGHLEGRRREPKPPVGPAELLALPNSLAKLDSLPNGLWAALPHHGQPLERKAPVGPAELLLLPNSFADLASRPVSGLAVFEIGQGALGQPALKATPDVNGHAGSKASSDREPEMNGAVNGHAIKASASADSHQQVDKVSVNGTTPNGLRNGTVSPPSSLRLDESVARAFAQHTEGDVSYPLKRRKSVRFSPTVESTTFLHSDPPSPNRSAGASSRSAVAAPNDEDILEPEATTLAVLATRPAPASTSDLVLDVPTEITNKEHFQLAPEEAFFLVFALGALRVVDPATGAPISTEHLLSLFRSHSYFPPRALGSGLQSDDPFLVNYAVYHHFRSLGWVPRHGIKFGVDWILYQRGPVFDHSEFGIMVMPAYSDPAWEGHEHQEPERSWSWLMGVNRVLSHVLKSLVLVYVDIPPPTVFDDEMRRGGIAAALKKYTIREVMVRRFSVNRNR
ncbi:hypothetical protein C8A00DRAFT_16653 [Chaetomidium leptoderma]|uniref:tRNA-intron lyase n=1 Tax=Chaetomidium leptoderma TaxID=669021 RepID=A0AAN6ZX31_9PEZI|nr:hypothetical protein C8A00DRAFT_16653 [Chaetomidium leptoderma]